MLDLCEVRCLCFCKEASECIPLAAKIVIAISCRIDKQTPNRGAKGIEDMLSVWRSCRIEFGEVRWGPVKSDLQALRLEKFTHTDTARFVESAWFLGLLLLESEAWMWRTVLALKFKSWGAEACTRRSAACQWKRLKE